MTHGQWMMNTSRYISFLLTVIVLTDLVTAQERRERTIDEVKTEAVHRAEVGQ